MNVFVSHSKNKSKYSVQNLFFSDSMHVIILFSFFLTLTSCSASNKNRTSSLVGKASNDTQNMRVSQKYRDNM